MIRDTFPYPDELEWLTLTHGVVVPTVVQQGDTIASAESSNTTIVTFLNFIDKSEIIFFAPEAGILTGIYAKPKNQLDFEYISTTRQPQQITTFPSSQKPDSSPETVADLLKNSSYAVVITGSESFLDYIYLTSDAQAWEQFNRAENASNWQYYYNPNKIWKYVTELNLENFSSIYKPLADLEKMDTIKAVVTFSVDGKHRKENIKTVVEMYGSMTEVRCSQCDLVFDKPCLDYEKSSIPPPCDHFRKQGTCISHSPGFLRPNVVLFGEEVPYSVTKEALEHINKCDLILVIGTISDYLVTELPLLAKRNGAKIVEINKTSSKISHVVDASYTGEAGPFMEKVVSIIKSK